MLLISRDKARHVAAADGPARVQQGRGRCHDRRRDPGLLQFKRLANFVLLRRFLVDFGDFLEIRLPWLPWLPWLLFLDRTGSWFLIYFRSEDFFVECAMPLRNAGALKGVGGYKTQGPTAPRHAAREGTGHLATHAGACAPLRSL